MPSNRLTLCCPLLLLPSIFPSVKVFSNVSALCIRWSKYWSISPSASVLPGNIQGWFPLGLTGLICLQSKGLSRVFSSTTVRKHQFFGTQPSWVPAIPRPTVPHPSNVGTGLGQQRMGVGARGFQEEDSQPRKTSSCVWVGEGSGEKQIKGQKEEKNRSLRNCSERWQPWWRNRAEWACPGGNGLVGSPSRALGGLGAGQAARVMDSGRE